MVHGVGEGGRWHLHQRPKCFQRLLREADKSHVTMPSGEGVGDSKRVYFLNRRMCSNEHSQESLVRQKERMAVAQATSCLLAYPLP